MIKSLSLYLGLYSATTTALLMLAAVQWHGISNELAAANENLKLKSAEHTYYKAEVARQSDRYEDLMSNRNDIQATVYKQQAAIARYMGREAVVYAKPGLVERLEKKAMDKFFKEVESDDD